MNQELEAVTKTVVKTFADFDIEMRVVRDFVGLNYHHIYLVPQKPVRMREVRSFADDLRFELEGRVVRIEAPVKGKREIAIKVTKYKNDGLVKWANLNDDLEKITDSALLTVPLGVSEEGQRKFIDITELPHLLIGGRMAVGKSNFLHGVINSLILRHDPGLLRLLLVDPKNEGMNLYRGLPHMMTDPILDPEKTVSAIKWLCREVERRCNILEVVGADNIVDYHHKMGEVERRVEPMPYILLVIDEFDDVMSEYGNETEKMLVKLVMMARTVGIHLLLSTSNAESLVLFDRLKTNIGSAMSFAVATKKASEVMIGQEGAEELSRKGTAMFVSQVEEELMEVQMGYISLDEVKDNVLRVKKRYGAVDENNVDLKTLVDYRLTLFAFDDAEDELYEEARKVVVEAGKASTSYLQRKLRIGYSRAARLMDMLEERGVIGPADGSAPRDVFG